MKTSALRIAGTAAVLAWGAVGLSACGTPAGPDTAKSATAQAASPASGAAAQVASPASGAAAQVASPASSATPAPTQARAYTSKDLMGLVARLKDAKGRPLTVMSGADLTKSIEQAKSVLASISVKPAECAPLALGSHMPSTSGVAVGAGAARDAATGAITAVSLTSGPGTKVPSQPLARPEVFAKCANLSFVTGGMKVEVKLTKLAGLGSDPATFGYRTDSALPGGQRQSAITGLVVHNGVLFTVTASGGSSEADAVSRAGKLLDQATALLGR